MIKDTKETQEIFAQRLCEILVKNKIFSDQESLVICTSFKESDLDNFEEFLLEQGLVEKTDLLKALSNFYKVPSFDVTGYFFETYLLHLFPKSFLIEYGVIPLEIDDDILVVIANWPEMPELKSKLEKFVTYEIEYFVGIKQDIVEAIDEYYDVSDMKDSEFDDMSMDEEQRLEKEAVNKDEEIEDLVYGDRHYDGHDDKG